VNLIVANGTSAALAAKAATTTIPGVFQLGSNAVQDGLVASLNRPGGNLMGVTSLATELWPKRLELLHECVPAAANTAVLQRVVGIPSNLEAAARTLGVQLHILHASAERDFDMVFATLAELQVRASR
jgi:putative tryptophan/tyrosine transport system substrate-binding protein